MREHVSTGRKQMTPELEAEIVRRYSAPMNQSLTTIRFATELGEPRIKEVLHKHGVKIRKPGPGRGFIHFGKPKIAKA